MRLFGVKEEFRNKQTSSDSGIDAAFIVRACNAHEELVVAANDVSEMLYDMFKRVC